MPDPFPLVSRPAVARRTSVGPRSRRALRAAVLAVVVLAAATSTVPSLPARAAGESLTWGGTTTITEQDAAASINSGAISIAGGALDSGSLEFAVTSATSADVLSLETVATPVTTAGIVSVVGSSIYLGNGTTADNVGSIDAVKDGDGTSLKVNFVNTFPNANFEADPVGTTVTGWTPIVRQVKLDAQDVLAGYPVSFARDKSQMACAAAYREDDAYDVVANNFTVRQFGVQVSNMQSSEGTRSLQLSMSATGGGGTGWVIHGPAVHSSEFQATANDVIAFDWLAIGGGDDYSVYGYIVRVDGANAGTQYPILDAYEQRDGTLVSFRTATHTIQASGTYRFVFVAGAHNKDSTTGTGNCSGRQGDSVLYIDNVVVVGNKVTAAVATDIARLIRYRNTSDAPPASRTVTATATYADGTTTASGSTTVTITPVNDAPVLSGDGGTTTIDRTIVETDASSVANPIADATGTLSASDPDGGSPTITFGIQGGSTTGGVTSLDGTYGTLEVTDATGAYRYVPDMAAIKPLTTGQNPVDVFTITVSDGSDASTGSLRFTVQGADDTEPTAPGIAAVIPGDGFLSVLVDPPITPVGADVTNFEYSLDGTTFTAFSPAVTAGPLQIGGLSNGTAYPVTIRAINSGGTSDLSNTVSGTPTAGPAINAPALQSFEPSTALTAVAEDFRISGFAPAETLLVTIGLSGHAAGTEFALAGLATSGASPASGYAGYADGTAVTDLAITGTQTQVNAALRGLRIATGATRSDFMVNVSASVASGSVVQSGSTGSFYEYVADLGITWDDALAAAATRTFAGVNGYLVTITSAEENAFVKDRINGATNVWIAATDAAEEGVWRWAAGPEGQNGGTVFFTKQGLTSTTVTYASWASNEPNNSGGTEHVAVTNWGSATGTWNDLRSTNSSSVKGYVVEYSEWGGRTFDAGAVVRSERPVSMGGPSLTGTAAVRSASLTWTAPTRTGRSVSAYALTVVPTVPGVSVCTGTATTCTVTGLEAGTEYTFRVTATWDDASTSVSNPISVRALATPAVPTSSAPPVIVAPPLPSGPVLRTGGVLPRPTVIPVARVGDVEAPVASTPAGTTRQVGTTTVSTATILEVGGVSLAVDVTGAGEVRTDAGAAPEVTVVRDRVARTSGGGLLPGTQVQAWLPLAGTNARPVVTIPVGEDGTFTGDLPFDGRADRQSDGRPLPIGRHVLQLVGVDAAGQVTVIEQTVRIEQPSPSPEPDRRAGAPPTLTPGRSIATNAGVPEAVVVVPVPDQRQARVEGSGWTMAVDIPSADGRVAPAEGGGALIELVEDDVAEVSGDGFLPGTRADVWLFSTPTLLGTVTIAADGTFSGTVPVEGIDTGEHTLQLQGVGTDGYVRAANLGVVVVPRTTDEPAAEPEPAPEPEAAPEPEPEDRVEVVTAAGADTGGSGLLLWIALLAAAAGSGWWFLLGRRRRDDEEEDAKESVVRP